MNESIGTHFFCTTVYTYWNQELHNDGSWSPSFMTSLTKIDNLDGIMAGITPKSTNGKNDLIIYIYIFIYIYRAMPFDGDEKAKHPRQHVVAVLSALLPPAWGFQRQMGFSLFPAEHISRRLYMKSQKPVGIWNPLHIYKRVYDIYIYL